MRGGGGGVVQRCILKAPLNEANKNSFIKITQRVAGEESLRQERQIYEQ